MYIRKTTKGARRTEITYIQSKAEHSDTLGYLYVYTSTSALQAKKYLDTATSYTNYFFGFFQFSVNYFFGNFCFTTFVH